MHGKVTKQTMCMLFKALLIKQEGLKSNIKLWVCVVKDMCGQINIQTKWNVPYIENSWINGQISPGIWNCNVRSEDSNTNNNQEGYNSRINKELKQIHPNPRILTSFIKKQMKLSEQEIIKVKCGLSKPKRRKVYKKLAERR